ncbi:MAG: chorismate mutase [Methanotrichaceae archaeon]
MSLAEHRQEVARIDEKIIKLIQQRVEISKEIFLDKKLEGRGINDPEQERLVLTRATDLAIELGLDAGAVKDIFRILIMMSLQKQHELQGDEQE